MTTQFRSGLIVYASLVLPALSVEGADDRRVTLGITMLTPEVVLGEPARLMVTLRNDGSAPVQFATSLHPSSTEVAMWISRDDRLYLRYSGSTYVISDGPALPLALMPKLAPKSEAMELHTILWNCPTVGPTDLLQDHVAFREAGRYWIRADATDRILGKLTGPSVSVLVKAPEGSDLEIWELIKGDAQMLLFIQHGIELPREKLGVLESFAGRPKGPLTDAVRRALKEYAARKAHK